MTKDILTIASAMKSIYYSVYEITSEENDLTEMKMHKMLYFAQKNHYKNFGEWLFEEDFEGWQHGPVNKKVRYAFSDITEELDSLTLEEEYTIREVVYEYGKYTAGVLRNISHQDYAYKISREGLNEHEPGNRTMLKENIIFDIPYQLEDLIEESEVE